VHREPHPFVSNDQVSNFVGRTVAFVGKVDKVDDTVLYMKTSNGKCDHPSKNIKANKW